MNVTETGFQKWMRESGITTAELGRACGVNRETARQWVVDFSKLRSKYIPMLIEAFPGLMLEDFFNLPEEYERRVEKFYKEGEGDMNLRHEKRRGYIVPEPEKEVPLKFEVRRNHHKYPFARLAIGDSFLVETKDLNEREKAFKRIYNASKRFSELRPRFFHVGRVPEGVRCWRITEAQAKTIAQQLMPQRALRALEKELKGLKK